MTRPLLIGRAPASAAMRAESERPDWIGADPGKIDRALRHALAKPSGGWCVIDASRAFDRTPRPYTILGRELVGWRCARGAALAPDGCPHMGAELSKGRVDEKGRIVCPWHGLALDGDRARGDWAPLVTHDDGVLVWARFDALLAPGEAPSERPFLCARPERALDAVIRMEGRCAPEDVIANRLDPWHGAHFHGHSFARLSVIDEAIDHVTVRVVYRIAGRVGMEVDARFDCPDPRTIVMTIVSGEGVGSVVETHATPIAEGRTAIVEATLATSERTSVSWLPRATLLRPLIEARARKLWVDDVAYCERRYALRRSKR
jgi:isorenieratene synthase